MRVPWGGCSAGRRLPRWNRGPAMSKTAARTPLLQQELSLMSPINRRVQTQLLRAGRVAQTGNEVEGSITRPSILKVL